MPMTMVKPLATLALGLALALSTMVHAAGTPDREAGRLKFSTCVGCHGIPGYTNAYPTYHVPRVGGQTAEYIAAALRAYQDSHRPHATMKANAADLSDQDIADIGAYLASLEQPDRIGRIRGDARAGQQKSETCAACHGADGNGPDPNFPRLAGQYEDYLAKTLRQYRDGERVNAIMNGMAAGLSDRDIADLAAFYASQRGSLSTVTQ